MKTLVVEDDFMNRKLMQSIFSPYGGCDVAVNGIEALEAFKMAFEEGVPYDLVCLDIMMPEMDGQEVLKTIRKYEFEMGRFGMNGTKIIMMTALNDFENVKNAFVEQCEAYLLKPVERTKLLDTIKGLGLKI